MRITVIVLFSAFYISYQPAGAQSFRADYESLVSLEKEFAEATEDVATALRDMAEATGEYRCINFVSRRLSHLSDVFAHYKFSVAIRDVVKDQEDREKVTALLMAQTELMQSDLKREHGRIKAIVALCSTVPMAVTKGTAVLTIIEKGEAVVRLIADKL